MSVVTSQRMKDKKYGGSAEGIRHHYDISNEYWGLLLGPSYTYSAGIWNTPDEDLETAQERKINWHLAAAKANKARSALEVGCGWGTILNKLAQTPQIKKMVGLTLSNAQAEYIETLRLPNTQVRVENWARYEPEGKFDSIISIGAFEHFAKPIESQAEKIAVYRDFFERCNKWLNPNGRMALQTIAFGNMKREAANEFMFTEIYPESDLPFLSDIVTAIEGFFEIVEMRNDRFDYARSYDAWNKNLQKKRKKALSMVGEEQVKRFEKFFKMGSIGMRMGKIHLLRFALRPISSEWSVAGNEN